MIETYRLEDACSNNAVRESIGKGAKGLWLIRTDSLVA